MFLDKPNAEDIPASNGGGHSLRKEWPDLTPI